MIPWYMLRYETKMKFIRLQTTNKYEYILGREFGVEVDALDAYSDLNETSNSLLQNSLRSQDDQLYEEVIFTVPVFDLMKRFQDKITDKIKSDPDFSREDNFYPNYVDYTHQELGIIYQVKNAD